MNLHPTPAPRTPAIRIAGVGNTGDQNSGLREPLSRLWTPPLQTLRLSVAALGVLALAGLGALGCGAAPAEASSPPADTLIRFGDFTLNIANMELLHRENKVALTTGEVELLVVLAQNPERVLTRDQLMDKLSGDSRDPFDRSIDVRITRLRSKIEENPSAPQFILTVWGKGYRFNPNGSAQG